MGNGTRKDKDAYSTLQRYEYVCDNGEDQKRWSDLLGNVTTIASGSEHVTGSRSVSFNKVSGVSADAYIIRPLDKRSGVNLDSFSTEGQILSSVYLPSIADVSSFNVALLMSSGTENGAFYSIPDTDLSTGWNHLSFDANDYTTQSGAGVDWHNVKYVAAGVSFDSLTDSMDDILLDSVRIQLPTATVNFDPNIDNITALSEVQIKNGDDPDELSVDSADTARTSSTNVIPVQEVDSTGKVSPAGESSGNAPFTKLTDGSDDLGFQRADAGGSAATIIAPTQHIDDSGNVQPAGDANTRAIFTSLTDGSDDLGLKQADASPSTSTIIVPTQHVGENGSSLPSGASSSDPIYTEVVSQALLKATHWSPVDFSVSYTSNVTITVAGAPVTVDDSDCVVTCVYYKPSGGQWQQPLINGVDGVSLTASSDVITVAGAGTPFAASDEYIVGIVYQEKAYDAIGNQNYVWVNNQDPTQRGTSTLADVTNGADDTYEYFFSPFDSNYSKLGIHMILNGGSGTVTVKFYGSMDYTSDASSATYEDITYQCWGTTAFTASEILVDDIGKLAPFSWVKVEVVASTSGSDDADWTIYLAGLYN